MTTQQPDAGAGQLENEVQALRDKLEDDPTAIIDYTNQRLNQVTDNLVKILESKFGEYDARIGGIGRNSDPEYVKYRDQVEALKQKDGFSELDDETLLKVVKGLSGAKIRTPRGAVSGGKPFAEKGKKIEITDEMRIKMGFEPRGS